jgi:hypothetical protein
MKRFLTTATYVLASCALGITYNGVSGVGSVANASAVSPAASPVSLSGWDLSLPVSASGAQPGLAAMVIPAVLDKPWLTRDSDGALAFWDPTTGATSAHSTYTRTELYSASDFTLANGTVRHTLTATVSVSQTPSDGHNIIIGQLHGGGLNQSHALAMLHYRAGELYSFVDGIVGEKELMSGVPLGAKFSYSITANVGKTMTLTVTYKGKTAGVTVTDPAADIGADERFQAGDYLQTSHSSSATDGGRVTFYALSMS